MRRVCTRVASTCVCEHYGIRVCFHNFRVQNIGLRHAPFRCASWICPTIRGHVSYEPTCSRDWCCAFRSPRSCFSSWFGKVVITGARRIEDISNTFKVYCEFLIKYKDTGTSSSSEYRNTKHDGGSAASYNEIYI